MNMQRQNRAKTQLDALKMTGNNIDEYISKFEELTRAANYTIGNEETANLFLKGLTELIICDLMKPPFPMGYIQIKERAIELAKSQTLVESLLKAIKKPGGNFSYCHRQDFAVQKTKSKLRVSISIGRMPMR